MKGTAKPDYGRVVDLTTRSALSALTTPALIAIISPILIGFTLKAEGLGAFLAGTILSGQLLAVFMANSGGAWDNAKKWLRTVFTVAKDRMFIRPRLSVIPLVIRLKTRPVRQ